MGSVSKGRRETDLEKEHGDEVVRYLCDPERMVLCISGVFWKWQSAPDITIWSEIQHIQTSVISVMCNYNDGISSVFH